MDDEVTIDDAASLASLPPDHEGMTLVTKRNKRAREPQSQSTGTNKMAKSCTLPDITSSNRFSVLSDLNDISTNTSTTIKIPPIFIKTNLDYTTITQTINNIIGPDTYVLSTTMSNVKVLCNSELKYRQLIHSLKSSDWEYHTYQLQSEKPDRIVIRGLHPTTPPEIIKEALTNSGFNVRMVCNISVKSNTPPFLPPRIPLPLFFVDLEPSEINKDIYKINRLLNCVIKIEPPRQKRIVPQCTRCQAFNHTKSYCQHPPRCLKCAQSHLTSDCTKDRSSPARCALCQGNHTANYKGCSIYKDLQKRRRPSANLRNQSLPPNLNKENYPTLPTTDITSQEQQHHVTSENTPSSQDSLGNSLFIKERNYAESLQSKRYTTSPRDPRLKNYVNKNSVMFTSNNDSHIHNLQHASPHPHSNPQPQTHPHLDLSSQLQNFVSQLHSLIFPLITLLTRLITQQHGP